MPSDLHSLEESLKNFLADEQDDKPSSISRNFYKYNNLKVMMEPKKSQTPHIIIRIGISEVVYNLIDKNKISGGLGSDEKIIRKWLEKPYIHTDLMATWEVIKRIKPNVTMNPSDLDE